MAEVNDDSHFLAHPDVKPLFSSVFNTLVAESDRGAVLVGASHVDNYLRHLFEAVAPKAMNAQARKRLLDYPGSLSTFAGRADVAFCMRLINETLHSAISHLRKLRNAVAHSPESFRLRYHEANLRGMYDLGEGVPPAMNRWALEIIIKAFMENLFSDGGPTGADGESLLNTPADAFRELARHPDVLAALEENRHRYELAIGIVLICALIVQHRDRAVALLGVDRTLARIK